MWRCQHAEPQPCVHKPANCDEVSFAYRHRCRTCGRGTTRAERKVSKCPNCADCLKLFPVPYPKAATMSRYTDTDSRTIELSLDRNCFYDPEHADNPLPDWLHELALRHTGELLIYRFDWTLELTIGISGDSGHWGQCMEDAVQGWEKHEIDSACLIGEPRRNDLQRVLCDLTANQRASIACRYDV